MSKDFYSFAGENLEDNSQNNDNSYEGIALDEDGKVAYSARIAIYDDPSMTPRVVVIEPKDIHSFLEEITLEVTNLSHQQGGTIPFMIIREVVENFIHAYFIQPTISILDGGNTIRFSDQGPGIKEKDLALEFGTSSATHEMKQYIRGVGSGLPNAMQYMLDKGGSLTIQDNISCGTIVTISTKPAPTANKPINSKANPLGPVVNQSADGYQQMQPTADAYQQMQQQPQPYMNQQPYMPYGQPMPNGMAPQPMPQYGNQFMQQQYMQQPYMQQGMAQQPQPMQPMQQPTIQQPSTTPERIEISERGRMIISYLNVRDNVGPSDLVKTFGGSNATWSRELSTLDDKGLLKKEGQKRYLTELGSNYLQNLDN